LEGTHSFSEVIKSAEEDSTINPTYRVSFLASYLRSVMASLESTGENGEQVLLLLLLLLLLFDSSTFNLAKLTLFNI